MSIPRQTTQIFEELKRTIRDLDSRVGSPITNLNGVIASTTPERSLLAREFWYVLQADTITFPTLVELTNILSYDRPGYVVIEGKDTEGIEYTPATELPNHAYMFLTTVALQSTLDYEIAVNAPGYEISAYVGAEKLLQGYDSLYVTKALTAGEIPVAVIVRGGSGPIQIDTSDNYPHSATPISPNPPQWLQSGYVEFQDLDSVESKVNRLRWANDPYAGAWMVYKAAAVGYFIVNSSFTDNGDGTFDGTFTGSADTLRLGTKLYNSAGSYYGTVYAKTPNGSNTDVTVVVGSEADTTPGNWSGYLYAAHEFHPVTTLGFAGTDTLEWNDTDIVDNTMYVYKLTALDFITNTLESSFSEEMPIWSGIKPNKVEILGTRLIPMGEGGTSKIQIWHVEVDLYIHAGVKSLLLDGSWIRPHTTANQPPASTTKYMVWNYDVVSTGLVTLTLLTNGTNYVELITQDDAGTTIYDSNIGFDITPYDAIGGSGGSGVAGTVVSGNSPTIQNVTSTIGMAISVGGQNLLGQQLILGSNLGAQWNTDGTIEMYAATGAGAALNDLSDVFNSAPVDKHVIIYDGVTDNRYENRLLTAADIVSGVFANDRISQSSVTQYQGVLSIAVTQLTGTGAGGTLDADLLDGQHGSYYLNYNNFSNVPTIGNALITIAAGTGLATGGDFTTNQTSPETITLSVAATYSPNTATELPGAQDLNTYQTAGFYYQTTNADAASGSNYPEALAGSLLVQNSAGVTQQYFTYNDGSPEFWFRAFYSAAWSAWRKVWHNLNDGSGSGLDADLLDGQHGTYYNSAANLTGVVPVASGGTNIASYTAGDIIYASGSTTLAKLSIAASGSYVRSSGVTPTWSTIPAADIPSLDASKITTGTFGAAQIPTLNVTTKLIAGPNDTFVVTRAGAVAWGALTAADIPNLAASKITSGQFTDLFSVNTRYSIGYTTGNATSTRDKFRVWTSSSYAIGMQSGFTFGPLQTEYAMTFQMNNQSTRGFWWGDDIHTVAQGAMALSTDGKLTLAHSMRIGYGEADTTVPGVTYDLDVSGSIYASVEVLTASDIRYKQVLGNIDGEEATALLSQIETFRFLWNDHRDARTHFGVAAQQILPITPEVVYGDDAVGYGVAYEKLVPVLIASVNYLSSRVRELEHGRAS